VREDLQDREGAQEGPGGVEKERAEQVGWGLKMETESCGKRVHWQGARQGLKW
jgi:hypothetical protein